MKLNSLKELASIGAEMREQSRIINFDRLPKQVAPFLSLKDDVFEFYSDKDKTYYLLVVDSYGDSKSYQVIGISGSLNSLKYGKGTFSSYSIAYSARSLSRALRIFATMKHSGKLLSRAQISEYHNRTSRRK